jgi:hypothetical protein
VKVLLLVALAAAALAVGVSSAQAADECDGLMVCIPVAGPWVVIPAAQRGVSVAEWQLKCPEGVVGGLDARASETAVAVQFDGLLGSPVNPGITTRDVALFTGTYAGRVRKVTAFRPFIGCIPGGGGQRTPTSVSAPAEVKPGAPVTLRVKTLPLKFGELARATHACRKGERLLRATHAIGIYSATVPPLAQLTAVRVVQVVRGGRILVSATRRGLPPQTRAAVQIHAECAR